MEPSLLPEVLGLLHIALDFTELGAEFSIMIF